MARELDLSRRSFIGVATGASAAALVGSLAAPAAARGEDRDRDWDRDRHDRLIPERQLGIQLFTIRDKVRDLGFRAVFEELARIGYKEVEFAGYTQANVGPITVEEIRRLLDDNGLRAVGTHVSLASWRSNLQLELDRAEILGLTYVGTANAPTSNNTVAGYQAAAEEFNRLGEAAAARGMKFYQHNHAGEFAFATDNPSVRLYDVFLAETDPSLVYLEMDIFWAYVGQFRFSSRPDPAGGPLIPAPFDPLDYVLRHPDRYPLFHVKDGVFDPTQANGYSMVDVGDGNIDYERFIRAVQRVRGRHRERYHHYIQERDTAPSLLPNPPGSFSSAERSYAYLASLRKGPSAC